MSRLIAGRLVSAAGLRSPGSRAPSHRKPTAPHKADFSLAPIAGTGCYIRRTNVDSSRRLKPIDADDITMSGLNSLAPATCKRLELRNSGVERYLNLERKAGTPDLLAETVVRAPQGLPP